MNRMQFAGVRRATMRDLEVLQTLTARSAAVICVDDYTPTQLDTALRWGAGVDARVIADGTYYVIEDDDDGRIVAGGGWSYRASMGAGWTGDYDGAPHDVLDPTTEAARIRGFCVHPDHVRRGHARKLLALCELASAHAGFARVALMSSLTGRRLFLACGYADVEPTTHIFPNGVGMVMHHMSKTLGAADDVAIPALARPRSTASPEPGLN